jgi:hypothetical protein
MQFAHAAGVEPHVHAGDILGDAELARRHLTRPPARLQSHMRVGKRETQVWQRAVVGGGRYEDVGVLPVAGDVARAGIGAAMSGALRLRHRVAGLRARNRCRREKAACRGRR